MEPSGSRLLPALVFYERNKGLIGRTALYDLVRSGRIPHVRLGRRILIPEDAFEQLLEGGLSHSAVEPHR